MKDKIYIGIDPAFRQRGFAIAILDEDNTLNFKVFKNGFNSFFRWVLDDLPENAIIGVENSNLQNDTFNMAGSRPVLAKRSRDVGKNQAVSQMTVDLLQEYLSPAAVYDISPKQKGAKIVNPVLFKAILQSAGIKEVYNYKGLKSEQDKRDAVQILLKTRALYLLRTKK